MSNYDRFPHITVSEKEPARGYETIIETLKEQLKGQRPILIAETYPGVRDEEIIPQLKKLNPSCFINMLELYVEEEEMTRRMEPWLTDDRVFGRMYYGGAEEFLDEDLVKAANEKIREADGLVIIYGVGASLLSQEGLIAYFDLARWEIQLRYRAGMGNYNCSNFDEDILRKYKRGYFVEWRFADRIKMGLFEKIDFLIDTNAENDPKMITGEDFRDALCKAAHRPFRLVPYFDPGVWGGQWMKEKCNLEPDKPNYAWSFDGVPEENSLLLRFGSTDVEIPAMDLTLYQPRPFLGEKNYARFGAEFPIRFDFLDTIDGQNLSLQVHPLTDYIKRTFGMSYTQDESYYILDAKEDACVYLGVKTGTKSQDMIDALKEAQETGSFDAEQFVNKIPAKKHRYSQQDC